jgi:hypothetical protein
MARFDDSMSDKEEEVIRDLVNVVLYLYIAGRGIVCTNLVKDASTRFACENCRTDRSSEPRIMTHLNGSTPF